jgi:hypothetical protein
MVKKPAGCHMGYCATVASANANLSTMAASAAPMKSGLGAAIKGTVN